MITVKRLAEEVITVAALEPYRKNDQSGCSYLREDGTPNCIIGQALFNLKLLAPGFATLTYARHVDDGHVSLNEMGIGGFLSDPSLRDLGMPNLVPDEYRYHEFLIAVQRIADNYKPWAIAVASASRILL